MSAGFYMDEDSLNGAVVAALRAAGVAVLTTTEAHMQAAGDEDQLTLAASRDSTVFTANVRDFARIHWERVSAGRVHAGIVVRVRQQMEVGAQVQALLHLLGAEESAGLANALICL